MNIKQITIITSLIFTTSSVYANEKLNNHEHHDHSSIESTKILDSNVVYVCPMHLDIMTEQPSSCPICGMNLEKVELEEE